MAAAGYPTDVSIITTYRCQMRCKMCDIWENPTDKKREIQAKELEILPNFKFVNITGGEPFVRRDLEDIVEVMFKKSDRIVISTSGWHTDRIIKMAEKYPNIGIRVSIEGLSQKNDDLRGREGSFDRAMRLLLTLKEMGVKDIGYGCTVSNKNSEDMLWLYKLSRELGMEFATAAFHNSYYFHKDDNEITNKDEVIGNFHKLIEELLKDNSPKSWYRAFFNLGSDQLHPRQSAHAALRGGHGQLLHRAVWRCLPLQWSGRSLLEGVDGQYPGRFQFRRAVVQRAGGKGSRPGSHLPQELLDGGDRRAGDEEVHQASDFMGGQEQDQVDAGQADLHR